MRCQRVGCRQREQVAGKVGQKVQERREREACTRGWREDEGEGKAQRRAVHGYTPFLTRLPGVLGGPRDGEGAAAPAWG